MHSSSAVFVIITTFHWSKSNRTQQVYGTFKLNAQAWPPSGAGPTIIGEKENVPEDNGVPLPSKTTYWLPVVVNVPE